MSKVRKLQSQIQLREVQKQVFEEATKLEEDLKKEKFTIETGSLTVVMSGEPKIVSLEIKKDSNATEMKNALNQALTQACAFRNQMASDLVNRKKQ